MKKYEKIVKSTYSIEFTRMLQNTKKCISDNFSRMQPKT